MTRSRGMGHGRHTTCGAPVELERIAVDVRYTAENRIDADQTHQRFEEHATRAHGQVFAFDQVVAQVAGQVRVFEVSRARWSGAQEHRARSVAMPLGERPKRVSQREKETGQPLDVAMMKNM